MAAGKKRKSVVPDTGSVLPEDAPPGHEAHKKVRLNTSVVYPFARFTIQGASGNISFQTTAAKCGSIESAGLVARACYLRLERGDAIEEVKQFREDIYKQIQTANDMETLSAQARPLAQASACQTAPATQKVSASTSSAPEPAVGQLQTMKSTKPPLETSTAGIETELSNSRSSESASDVGVVSPMFGPEPLVRLFQEGSKCPKSLLPEDGRITESKLVTNDIKAELHDSTSEEARALGLETPAVPQFLGQVPPEIVKELASMHAAGQPPWKLLLIVGPSGSGKTCLLKSLLSMVGEDSPSLYPEAKWRPGEPIVQHFPSFEQAQNWFCGVGLSSVPAWCKPFSALSLGEQYRANVARCLSENLDASSEEDTERRNGMPLVFDEWTSELDRGVARSVCTALRKRLTARRKSAHVSKDPPLILATCHEDVQQYLDPDVVIRCEGGQPPKVEFLRRVGEGENSGEKRELLCAELRGTFEPMPPGGSVLARWQVNSRDWSQEVFVRRANGSVKFTMAGFAQNAGDGQLRPETSESLTSCDKSVLFEEIAKGCDAGWLETYLPKMDPPIEVRIKLVEPDRLLMQTRAASTELAERREEVAQIQKVWVHILALARPTTKENERVYKSKRFARLGQVSKLARGLSKKEELALELHPNCRSKHQKSLVERYLCELEARRSENLKNKVAWDTEVEANRMPSISNACLDFLLSDCNGHKEEHPVSVAYDYPENCRRLREAGWYMPEKGPSRMADFPGLALESSENFSSRFRFDPRLEVRQLGQVHLASYVGEADGSLSFVLEQVARLLDSGFDGLCVHEVPSLKPSDLGDFTVGVIVGPSSSGKTTLAMEHFGGPVAVHWLDDVPALLHFHSLAEAEPALEAASLDLKTAMRPAGLLSGGERERASLARGLADWAAGRRKSLVVDEFTSLLDRSTAQLVAQGVNSFLQSRPELRGLVLLSCHFDILGSDMLEPSWIFDCADKRLHRFDSGTFKRNAKQHEMDVDGRVKIPHTLKLAGGSSKLVVRRAVPCEWRHFREHHYKDHRLMPQAACFVGELDGRAVAFTAVLVAGFALQWVFARNDVQQMQATAREIGIPVSWMSKNIIREHRTVVMPDCQGLGLGSLMADCIANLVSEHGYCFMSTTAHPTYGGYRDRSPFWTALPSNQRERAGNQCSTFSHLWIGAVSPDGKIDEKRATLLAKRLCGVSSPV